MTDSSLRTRLRRQLEAHLAELGYSCPRTSRTGLLAPEIVRTSLVRGRIAYGETVVHTDLRRRQCHERLVLFSRRRTRRHSSILFFIGVAEADQTALETLLQQLDIRTRVRGGHVHVVPIAAPESTRRRTPVSAVGE